MMKKHKANDKTRTVKSISNHEFDIDALTSLVTEEKKSSSNRSQVFARREIYTQSNTIHSSDIKNVSTTPRVDFIPQEWGEKLYPRLGAAAQKECRKVYIGGLGASTTDGDVTKFLKKELKEQCICDLEEMILNIEMRNDVERKYRFCFVEFMHEDLANMTMSLHDKEFTNCDGKTTYIKVGRTKDFPGPIQTESLRNTAFIGGLPIESIDKGQLINMFSDEEIGKVENIWVLRDHKSLIPKGEIFIQYTSDESVQRLISAFKNEEHNGEALFVRKATHEDRYNVVKMKELSISEGLLRFLTFCDPPQAITNGSLNEFLKVYDESLVVGPSEVHNTSLVLRNVQEAREGLYSQALNSADGRTMEHAFQRHYKNRKLAPPSRILVLLNMIDENELEEDDDFENLKEDIEEELEKYGLLEDLVITRFPPSAPTRVPSVTSIVDKKADPKWLDYEAKMEKFHNSLMHPVLGHVGRVFAVYMSANDAINAQKNISGKKFNGRSVITSFISERYIFPDKKDGTEKYTLNQGEKRLALM